MLHIDNCELYLQRGLYAKEASTRVNGKYLPEHVSGTSPPSLLFIEPGDNAFQSAGLKGKCLLALKCSLISIYLRARVI